MALGIYFEPELSVPSEPSAHSNTQSPQRQTEYEGEVTCNADCQVTFGLSDGSGAPSGSQAKGDSEAEGQPDQDSLDLLAQRRMAHWAMLLTGLTAAGLILLAGTLWEAAEATSAANKAAEAADETTRETTRIGEAQVRGYVSVAQISLAASDDDGLPVLGVKVENTGTTPVYELRVASDIRFTPRDSDKLPDRFNTDVKRLRASLESATIASNNTATIHAKYGGEWPKGQRAGEVIKDRKIMHYFGLIFYRDVFDILWEQDFYQLIRWSGSQFYSTEYVFNAKPRRIENYPTA